MAEEGLPGPVVTSEEGDIIEGVAEKGTKISSLEITLCSRAELALRKAEEHKDKNEEVTVSKSLEKQHTEGDQTGEDEEETETMNVGLQSEALKEEVARIQDKSQEPAATDDGHKPNDPQLDVNRLNVPEQQGTQSQAEDPKEAHRLTPDFPDALYELLCTLQEGRRLNDQRCSFILEGRIVRRRCHSEPNTTKPAHRVVFSSMTSLQKEEFFELVATAQARRLDDQRAQLERSPLPKPKARTFRGSIKQLSFVRKPTPVPVPKDDLYNMILTTQAQGRLEDQRSRAPGPMDDEDFFSLLLRVQGGRMEEQRTELPRMLET